MTRGIIIDNFDQEPPKGSVEVNGKKLPIVNYVLAARSGKAGKQYTPVLISSRNKRLRRFDTLHEAADAAAAAQEFHSKAFRSKKSLTLMAVVVGRRRPLFECLGEPVPELHPLPDLQAAFQRQVEMAVERRTIERLRRSAFKAAVEKGGAAGKPSAPN